MIKLIFQEGLFCPMVFCAACKKPIREAKKAIVVFRVDPSTDPDMKRAIDPVYLLHKACDHAFCDPRGGRPAWWWMPLKDFLVYVVGNCGAVVGGWATALEVANEAHDRS